MPVVSVIAASILLQIFEYFSGTSVTQLSLYREVFLLGYATSSTYKNTYFGGLKEWKLYQSFIGNPELQVMNKHWLCMHKEK